MRACLWLQACPECDGVDADPSDEPVRDAASDAADNDWAECWFWSVGAVWDFEHAGRLRIGLNEVGRRSGERRRVSGE